MKLRQSLLRIAQRVAPVAYQRARRWHHSRHVREEIRSGCYDPQPAESVHFGDYDRPIDAASRVPLTWHLTWKSADLPPRFEDVRSVIQSLHPAPAWTHKFWTDEAIRELVDQRFPGYREAFIALPRQIMRIDVFRYMVLAAEGGVYCDLDFRMFKPADDALADCQLLLPAESDSQASSHFLAQHFLASRPGHPFWTDLLAAILNRPLSEIRAFGDPVEETGPGRVTGVWRTGATRYRAKIPKRIFFSPPTSLAERPEMISRLSYGIHDCAGTWR